MLGTIKSCISGSHNGHYVLSGPKRRGVPDTEVKSKIGQNPMTLVRQQQSLTLPGHALVDSAALPFTFVVRKFGYLRFYVAHYQAEEVKGCT